MLIIAGSIVFLFKHYVSGLFLVFMALGLLANHVHQPNPSVIGRHSIDCEALSIEDASTFGRNAIVRVNRVDSADLAPFKMRVHFLSDSPYLTAGMSFSADADIKDLYPPCAIPDAIDLQANLRRQGIGVRCELLPAKIADVRNTPGILPWFRRVNARLSEKLMMSGLSASSINMLNAMLLGDGKLLPADTRELYSSVGLAHLLALSGMHVGIIAMLVTIALWPLYVGRHNRTRLSLTIIALWLYALLTDFSPSVTRAVIMSTVYMIGRIIQRNSVSINSLCLAAIVVLLVNPTDLNSVGFQLSFAAVAGIVIFYPLINRVDYRNHPWLYRLVSYPALSLSAMIITGVVSAFHFHSFPLLFLFSNLAIVPLIPVFVSAGAVVLLLALTGIDVPWVDVATDRLGDAINRVAEFTASFGVSSVDGIYLPAWAAVLFVAVLIVAGVARHNHRPVYIWGALIFAIGGVGTLFITAPSYPVEEMYFTEDYRTKNLIVRRGSRCVLYTDAKTDGDRREVLDMQRIILRDFLAKRGIDSLQLAVAGRLPVRIIDGDTLVVALDACAAPDTIACRKL